MQRFSHVLALLTCLLSLETVAKPLVLESTVRQSTLIELYTSEGCSSCPPAERFLNGFTGHPDLWTRYIPVAFHVDYWDDLGWKDRFSKARYSKRQRTYARLNGERTVYTPAFRVNGARWRPGFYTGDIEPSEKNVGRLRLVIENGQMDAVFEPVQPTGQTELNIALLGMGIETRIRAGERAGSHTRHEFVVLDHRRFASQDNHWSLPFPGYQSQGQLQGIERFAIVAWVSRPGDPAPLQSVGSRFPLPGVQTQ